MRLLAYALTFALLLVLAAAGGAAVYLAASRGSVSPPVVVEPGLAAEKGAGAFLYAVRAGGGCVLVDAGMDPKGRPIDAALKALGLTRREVTDVFLTHGHADHTAGTAAVPLARLHSGAGDVGMAPRPDSPPRGFDWLLAPLVPRGPARVDDPIDGEKRIDLGGGEEVLAIPVPGHSGGSMAYLVHRVLFVGDAVSYEDGKLVEAPRLFSDDPDRNVRSVAGLAARLSGVPVSRICTGHGGCTPEGSASRLLGEFAAQAR